MSDGDAGGETAALTRSGGSGLRRRGELPHPDTVRHIQASKALPAMSALSALCAVLILVVGVDPLVAAVATAMVAVVPMMALRSMHLAAARRYQPVNREGLLALGRGELDRAEKLFRPWIRTRGTSPAVRRAGRYNLGFTTMQRGDLEQAIALHTRNEQGPLGGELKKHSAVQLALCLGLRGDLEVAAAWVREAERRAGTTVPPLLIVARAVVDCRRGEPAAAAKLLADEWNHLEGQLTAAQLRPARVLRSFAVHAAEGPRGAGRADKLLAACEPRFAGEYRWLGVAWPEMQTFLRTHGLWPAPAAPAAAAAADPAADAAPSAGPPEPV